MYRVFQEDNNDFFRIGVISLMLWSLKEERDN